VDGLIVVDKPEGPTSHDVVARVRRILGERRVGHTGTLDPLATGVLPLVLGRATRLARFLTADSKHYRATIRLGSATTTNDRLGEFVGPVKDAAGVSREAVEEALNCFRGSFLQTPPAFSAKKLAGTRAYDLARRGEPAIPAAVAVTVHTLHLLALDEGVVELEVRASAGFYVRALAHDLGAALDVGGHLVALRRIASGQITEADAVPLAEIEADPAAATGRLRPMSSLLTTWPTVFATLNGLERVRRGLPLRQDDCTAWPPEQSHHEAVESRADGPEGVSVRVLGPDGDLVALASWSAPEAAAALHPRIVLV
jgi:tRNA pseudouridine55 synthase